MRVEAFGKAHRPDAAVGRQFDLALGQVQIQRLAPGARRLQQVIGGPERADHSFQQRLGRGIGFAIGRGLRLLIGQRGAAALDRW